MKQSIGLPSSNSPYRALTMTNNSAGTYGKDIATSPYEISIVGDGSASLVPGISPLNVSLLLKDSFGHTIRGSADLPIPYILESWTCPSSSCSIQKSLTPLGFLSFDPLSGICNSLASRQTVLCIRNESMLVAQFSVYGSTSSSLSTSFSVRCVSCGASQVRIEHSYSNTDSAWYCSPCLAGQYIIDPNRDTCQNCPSGEPFQNYKIKILFLFDVMNN